MPAERFYIDAPLEGTLTIEGVEYHHMAHVMRTQIGEVVEIVNGKGALAKVEVLALSKKNGTLQVLSSTQTQLHEPTKILAIPFMRPSKLEWVIEKCTELGADAFWLYPAQFSDKESISKNQLERFHHLAISAMKQCGRLDLPPIKILDRFADLFLTPATFLFGDTGTTNTEKKSITKPLVFITGPEAGFSEKELKLLTEKGTGICLHRNILRAETAPLAALFQLSLI
jgi:16S rRNA (uracil1498-N3)-methyltransferase